MVKFWNLGVIFPLIMMYRLALLCMLFFVLEKQGEAATIVSNGVIVTTFSENSTVDKDPAINVDLKGIFSSNGRDVGEALSSAGDSNVNVPSDNGFLITETSALTVSLQRTINAGSPSDASALAQYEVSFSLVNGESGQLDLDFDYLLSYVGLTSSVIWSLAGPDSSVSGLSGTLATDSTTTNLSGATSQSISVATAGLYVFTIQAEVPLQSLPNTTSGMAEISNFSLSYTPVTIPEPSNLFLFGIAVTSLLRRQRKEYQSRR